MDDVDSRPGEQVEEAAPDVAGPFPEPGGSLVDPARSHLIDRESETWVMTASSAPVISLSPAHRRLLASAARSRRTCILVTGDDTSLTPAYDEVASLVGARWVVSGEHGVRDARIGRRLRVAEDVVSRDAGFDRALEHARLPDAEIAVELEVSATFRHRNREAAPFGAVVEALRSALAPDAALEWGIAEPVNVAWDQGEVAEYLREQLSHSPWVFVSGERDDGTQIAASIRCRETKQGSEEIVLFRVAVGAEGSSDAAEALASGARAFEAVAAIGVPLFGTIMGRVGRADLHASPTVPGPAAPIGMLIGAPGLAAFEGRERDIAAATGGTLVGPSRRPSLVVQLGSSIHPDNLDRVREVLVALGPQELAGILGEDTVTRLLGSDWREASGDEGDAAASKSGDDADGEGVDVTEAEGDHDAT